MKHNSRSPPTMAISTSGLGTGNATFFSAGNDVTGNVESAEEFLDGDLRNVETKTLCVLLVVLALTGLCGNVAVLKVFSRPSKRDRFCPGASATMYVLALAVADLVTCVVVMPATAYVEIVEYHISNDFLCKLYQVSWCSGWTTDCLSTKR